MPGTFHSITTGTGADPEANLSPDVIRFCQESGLLPDLRSAVRLARELYAPVKEVAARIQEDPETDERGVIVDVTVGGELDEVLRRKKEYTKRWVQLASPEARERIRVLYHFG